MSQYFVGTQVEARGLTWEITDVRAMGDQTMLRLRGFEGIFERREVDLLTPFEEVRPVTQNFNFARPTQLANWRTYQQAFLLGQGLGSNAFATIQPGRLRIEPYQLVPVVRALRMTRPRLLLADDVGLGKTAEAGLVVAELMARRRAARVLVVSPAGPLLDQWKSEMLERFGLLFEVIDRLTLDRVRRTIEMGSNPLDFIPLALTSMDFLKQEKILDMVERALPYDVIVVDEAHHYSESGSTDPDETADRSQRRKLGEVLARRSDSLLLLSATPHDGYERSFASLMELLDPILVDGQGRLRGQQYRQHLVRRLKRHVKLTNPETGEKEEFKERKVIPVEVETADSKYRPFVIMHQQLLGYVGSELRRAMAARNYDDALAYLALLKRSTSTVEALYLTLDRVQSRLARIANEQQEQAEARSQRLKTLKSLEKKLARFGTLSAEEEAERQELEVEDLARKISEVTRDVKTNRLAAQQSRITADSLAELKNVVEAARQHDPKLATMVAQIHSIREVEPGANVLIYTEYKDSQHTLVHALLAAGLPPPLTLNGEDSEEERKATNDIFRTRSNQILVATDAAAEGLNLQHKCHNLLHLELPWNPNRAEQRNGRIDRYGQTQEPVIRLLFLCGTFEERILARLIAKYEQQRKQLRFVPNTLGLGLAELPAEGLFALLSDEEATTAMGRPCRRFKFEQPGEGVEGDRDVADLLAEIDKSLRTFERTARDHNWLATEGAFAEESQIEGAEKALEFGRQAGGVELAEFVCDAVRLEGGQVRELSTENVIELTLPRSWQYGLDGFPGWSSDEGKFRFTRNLAVEKDSKGRAVGFLGRSHPVVQRAVEHVRRLELGQDNGADRRVSAAYSPEITNPALVVSFVARVQSQAGREWERLFAVRVANPDDGSLASASQVLLEATRWLPELNLGAPTAKLWENQYSNWGEVAIEQAKETARQEALRLAEEFTQSHLALLNTERRNLTEWLTARTNEIIGRGAKTSSTRPSTQQASLFDEDLQPVVTFEAPPNQTVADSVKAVSSANIKGAEVVGRLATFAADKSRTSRERSEAEVVLHAYQQRSRSLEERAELRAVEVQPIGILMLLPASVAQR